MATIIEQFKLSFGKPTIEKDPDNKLDYTADFTDWLTRCGDTIDSVAVTYTGVTEYQAPTHDDNTVTIWVQGGTAGATASARIRITTVGVGAAHPRIKDQTVYFKIKER